MVAARAAAQDAEPCNPRDARGALDRPGELKGHINGALNNGATPDEIYEVFLQAAIYCGVPAAHTGVCVAAEVFGERGLL